MKLQNFTYAVRVACGVSCAVMLLALQTAAQKTSKPQEFPPDSLAQKYPKIALFTLNSMESCIKTWPNEKDYRDFLPPGEDAIIEYAHVGDVACSKQGTKDFGYDWDFFTTPPADFLPKNYHYGIYWSIDEETKRLPGFVILGNYPYTENRYRDGDFHFTVESGKPLIDSERDAIRTASDEIRRFAFSNKGMVP